MTDNNIDLRSYPLVHPVLMKMKASAHLISYKTVNEKSKRREWCLTISNKVVNTIRLRWDSVFGFTEPAIAYSTRQAFK